MSVDAEQLERELCRIPEITAARVVAEADGRITEVHILSAPSKHAKQVVRDVQSVALATFGIDLDRRIVSVVQLDNPNGGAAVGAAGGSDDGAAAGDAAAGLPASPADTLRINVEAVTAVRNGVRCTANVTLLRGDDAVSGSAEGLVAAGSVVRLVAQATLDALRAIEPAAGRADVETASLVRLGDRSVAVVTVVVVVPPYEEVLSGSAVVRSAGELDAVARAVLDATNRRLPQLR
ncbi:MAG TPA: hypothetical protein VHN98_07215 [Acidimicrobiales bacterium]|nr:hypothetical protein [Acidimicrobiales bacterium]